jgi:hypothetical protein
MRRTLMAAGLALLLAACWQSEARIFDRGDWANLGLEGNYTSFDANGDEQARVVLRTRPGGLVDSSSTDLDNGKVERSVLGFVRIEGGSGRYFLAVDRSDEGGEGDLYLIAHLTEDGAIAIYWPECAGTPPVEGLVIERDGLTEIDVCTFSSRSALMEAGLEAERFLSAKHIVAVSPLGRLQPDTDESAD